MSDDFDEEVPRRAIEDSAPVTSILSNKQYNAFKWIAQILLPASGTLYYTLSNLWLLPHAAEVVGTITAVDAFLGLLLGLSTYQYNKSGAAYDGVMAVVNEDDKTTYSLSLNGPVEDLQNKSAISFKVKPSH